MWMGGGSNREPGGRGETKKNGPVGYSVRPSAVPLYSARMAVKLLTVLRLATAEH